MSGVNRVLLLGRLGKDPEIKNVNGVAICNFSIATSKEWKDESGDKQEKVQWTDVVAFRKLAEITGKYLTKGSQCFIEGEISTRSWEDKDTGTKKYRTEVIAHNVQFLGAKRDNNDQPIDTNPVDTDTTSDPPF